MKHIYEAIDKMTPTKLDRGLRVKANKGLEKAGLDGNERFQSIGQAVNAVWKVLSPLGLEPDAGVPYTGGKQGSLSQGLRFSNKTDPHSPTDIANSVLYMSWSKLENGFEVVGYLS